MLAPAPALVSVEQEQEQEPEQVDDKVQDENSGKLF